ncbi:MAG: MCE family protein [bacterium]|nr:MCE family protein [bacterium]
MKRKREVQVGITVIMSLVVLIWGMLWFKQVRFAGGVSHYAVEFSSVGGLQTHDRVQVRGIRSGAVEKFVMVGDKVRVDFYVEPETRLTQDSRIALTSMGIVGEMLVEITPGSGPPAPEGHVFRGEVLKDMGAMMNEGAATLEEARTLTRELTAFMQEVREGDRVGAIMDDTRSTMASLRATNEELTPEVKHLVADLRATTAAVRTAVAGPDSLLAGTLRGAGATLARADSLTILLTRTTTSLAALVERLESGQGTAGRILKDDSLYAQAESTIVAVQDLIADVKARPKRYFHMSLF